MAQSSATGSTAQILTHTRFDRAPVVQQPRRGRLPNSVIKFWQASYEPRRARRLAQEHLEALERARERVVDHEILANMYRQQVAELTQTQRAANV